MGKKRKKRDGEGSGEGNSGDKKPPILTYDIDHIRQLARNQWPSIYFHLAGLNPDLCDGNHHPCPKCGGTDRWRYTNKDGDGSIVCNNCGKFGNGFKSLEEHLLGEKFAKVLALVADRLGVEGTPFRPDPRNRSARGGKSQSGDENSTDPAKSLRFQPWNDIPARSFCSHKPGVTPAAIQAVGGQIARYDCNSSGTFTVIAIPVWGKDWADIAASKPVGWVLYEYAGKSLPKRHKDKESGEWKAEWLKPGKSKLAAGSGQGIIADRARLLALPSDSSAIVWKLEGSTDLLSFLSLPELPAHVAPFTTANGAGERPQPWMLDIVAGRQSITLGDADVPGEKGAESWAGHLAAKAACSRKTTLPYPPTDTHGKDLRDWICEGNGCHELDALPPSEPYSPPDEPLECEASGLISSDSANGDSEVNNRVLEAGDDPHYLARVNLQRYSANSTGGTLRYWRDEWYAWKQSRGCYRKIEKEELKAKVAATVKEEFDRQWREEYEHWKNRDSDNEDDDCPVVKKVTNHLILNVLGATASTTVLSSSVELGTWIDDDGRQKRNCVAMKNGILDLNKLLSGESNCLLPHSSDWFSTICLPYSFDPDADCPLWKKYLYRCMEGDIERMKLLQQWAGYLLLPTTDLQKFMFFEGDGSNGKSVYLAAIEGMLGIDNCCHISLENFGKDFALTPTLGKLANISAECSEMDSVAEGYLKSFTSGDRMTFNRKGLSMIDAYPTARLMFSANVRPRFADKSSGLWRRMIVMPWRVKIPEAEQKAGMDKTWWWEKSGELPGLFNWAVAGLFDLHAKLHFCKPKICEAAMADYRKEVNPAGTFINEHYVQSVNGSIRTKYIYKHYQDWCKDTGHSPMNDKNFGRELLKCFPDIEKVRQSDAEGRFYAYVGIELGNPDDKIDEVEQPAEVLFQ